MRIINNRRMRFAWLLMFAVVMSCPFVKTRQGDVHSTRAPPVFLSL